MLFCVTFSRLQLTMFNYRKICSAITILQEHLSAAYFDVQVANHAEFQVADLRNGDQDVPILSRVDDEVEEAYSRVTSDHRADVLLEDLLSLLIVRLEDQQWNPGAELWQIEAVALDREELVEQVLFDQRYVMQVKQANARLVSSSAKT